MSSSSAGGCVRTRSSAAHLAVIPTKRGELLRTLRDFTRRWVPMAATFGDRMDRITSAMIGWTESRQFPGHVARQPPRHPGRGGRRGRAPAPISATTEDRESLTRCERSSRARPRSMPTPRGPVGGRARRTRATRGAARPRAGGGLRGPLRADAGGRQPGGRMVRARPDDDNRARLLPTFGGLCWPMSTSGLTWLVSLSAQPGQWPDNLHAVELPGRMGGW
jgi:hypothetical protein